MKIKKQVQNTVAVTGRDKRKERSGIIMGCCSTDREEVKRNSF